MDHLSARVGDIPVRIVLPDRTTGGVALWLSHLGGSAERTLPELERLADAGRPAVSFDVVGHGERGDGGDPWAMAGEVLADFRRRMWPMLGQSTLEAMRVLTWAQERTGTGDLDVVAGGVSMGGDIAIALAGVDDRVGRVATIGSTPDWRRPDMRELADPSVVVDQGSADRYAAWFAEHLDPARHLDRFVREVHIDLELGGADRHIPAAQAQRFVADLTALDPAAGSRVAVHVHDGLDHLGVTTSPEATTAALSFLTGPAAAGGRD